MTFEICEMDWKYVWAESETARSAWYKTWSEANHLKQNNQIRMQKNIPAQN